MAQYNAIKAAVNAYIKANGRKEITGQILNSVLNAAIDSLGRFFQFAGEARPDTDPGTPDQNVTYLAGVPGTYTHFNGLVIDEQEIALLMWNGSWVKHTMLIGIREVVASVDNQVGTPSVDVNYDNAELSLAFHNMKGDPGTPGAAAGFGVVSADISGDVGTPGVSVETSGTNTEKNITFHFTNLRGDPGVESVNVTIDNNTGIPSAVASVIAGVLSIDFHNLKGDPGVGLQSADTPTPPDGTAIITLSNGDTITLDLNHDHAQYTKVVMCADIAEYNAITTKDAMTFYIIPEVAVYLGDTLVMSQSSPLPYTPLSYIQTDGTAYIDTGIKGNTPRSAELKITPKQATSFCYHLGCRASTTRCGLLSQWGAPNESYDNSLTYSYNSSDWNGSVINIASSITNGTPLETKTSFKGGTQILSVKQSGGTWANTSNNQIASSVSTNLNMFIGACNNDGTANRVAPSGTRYHYVKIYSDENYTTLVFNGVPCLYNGEYGLWDRVTNAFFGNAAGSGAFTGA